MSDGLSDLEALKQADKVQYDWYQSTNAYFKLLLIHLCFVSCIAGPAGRSGIIITDNAATVSANSQQYRVDKNTL
jgi:hypothetical protein